jgi:hypothetical protein
MVCSLGWVVVAASIVDKRFRVRILQNFLRSGFATRGWGVWGTGGWEMKKLGGWEMKKQGTW